MKTFILAIVAVFLSVAAAYAANPCMATWTSPGVAGTPVTVSGTISMTYTYVCAPGYTVGSVQLLMGCADSLTTDHSCPTGYVNPFTSGSRGYLVMPEQANDGAISFNTAVTPSNSDPPNVVILNQDYDANIMLFDASGNFLGSANDTSGADRDMILNIQNSSTGGSFSAGAYLLGSSWVIDGGFYQAYWDYPILAESYANNQPNIWQQFIFTSTDSGFTICNAASTSACLGDSGTGYVNIGQVIDTWTVTADGNSWALKDTRTGKYMGAIPTSNQLYIPMLTGASPVTLTPVN